MEDEGIYDTTKGKCRAAANLKGAHIPCILGVDHTGWAHQNIEHGLLWDDPETREQNKFLREDNNALRERCNSYLAEIESLRAGLTYQNQRADEAERLVDKYRGFDTEPEPVQEEAMLKGQELPYMDPGLRLEALKLAVSCTESSEDAVVMAKQFTDFLTGQSQKKMTVVEHEPFDKGWLKGWGAALREARDLLNQGGLPALQQFIEEQAAHME